MDFLSRERRSKRPAPSGGASAVRPRLSQETSRLPALRKVLGPPHQMIVQQRKFVHNHSFSTNSILSRAVPAVEKFNYQNFKFDYEPYPLGVAREFVEPEFYRRLVESFPSIELFDTFFDVGSNKKVLAELYRPDTYHRFIRESPAYLEFYKYIKSSEFIHDVLNVLRKILFVSTFLIRSHKMLKKFSGRSMLCRSVVEYESSRQ
jgi:hypothetical protein